MSSRRVVVVGAGIAGASCARRLVDGGADVTLLDRGRRLGGRMAVRTQDGHAVDLGASYLTVRDDRLAAVVRDWERRGIARPWTDTFATAGPSGLTGTKSGPVRWAAVDGLRSLVEDLAAPVPVERRTVEQVDAGGVLDGEQVADDVVLAMPDPQAARLLGPSLASVAEVAVGRWQPALAVAARWPSRWWPDLDGAFVADHDVLSFVADDGRRRGDGAPVLVAHTTPDHAANHLDDPEAAVPEVLSAVGAVLGGDGSDRPQRAEPAWTHVQRWTYAQPADAREEPFHLDAEARVALCGDGWHAPSRVEAAFLSGLELADALLDGR